MWSIPPPADTSARAVREIARWLDGACLHLLAVAPDLRALVTDYVGEARFGAEVIASDLAELPPGAGVLEIGAGTALLSCAVHAAGYDVTAVEPLATGFSHMGRIRDLVLEFARDQGRAPDLIERPAEALDLRSAYDFAFSINTMEHVADVREVLEQVWAALRPGGAYRFVCPNYAFPFEPHFGIPTAGTKALTWRLFRRRILASRLVVDPVGTWTSLNWISVSQVRKICQRSFGLTPEFDRRVFSVFVQRAIRDQSFQRRHGVALRTLASVIEACHITPALALVPAALQPAMSCRITRPR